MTTDGISDIIESVRREERERAARIVEDWFVYTPYIVARYNIEERKKQIAKAIRGEYEEHYSGA